MRNPDRLVAGIEARHEQLNRRAQYLLRCLNYTPGRSRRAKKYGGPIQSIDIRAHAVVSIMAELEAVTRNTLFAVHRELNVEQVRICDLQPCLRSLVAQGHFQSLRTSQQYFKTWQTRGEVTRLNESIEIAKFPTPTRGPIPPLDGRTLVPEHFLRIWAVYGLDGEALPSARTRGYLQKLALARNDIAHANQDFDEIFREPGRETSDIIDYVEHTRQFSMHLSDEWRVWIARSGYLGDA